MVVTVAFDAPGTCLRDDRQGGFLILREQESLSDYAAWPFHVDGEESDMPGNHVWTWENPEDGLGDITLSPSLRYEGGIGPDFHINIRNGDVEHHQDCHCGCR